MSSFIQTRNALQCRSHHQKLEEKYIRTSKIVATFKPYFRKENYRSAVEALEENKMIQKNPDKIMKSIEIQTEIAGTSSKFIKVDGGYLIEASKS